MHMGLFVVMKIQRWKISLDPEPSSTLSVRLQRFLLDMQPGVGRCSQTDTVATKEKRKKTRLSEVYFVLVKFVFSHLNDCSGY